MDKICRPGPFRMMRPIYNLQTGFWGVLEKTSNNRKMRRFSKVVKMAIFGKRLTGQIIMADFGVELEKTKYIVNASQGTCQEACS